MQEAPKTLFARNGDVHIAYQTVGSGPLDILLVDTWVHHVEIVWDFPDFARFLRRLASFGRLIHFDRRGTGLSDPVPLDRLPDLETQVEDVIAVLDAAGSARPAVVGVNDGTLVAMLLAAAHPDRCASLVLWSVTAKHHQAAGMPMEAIDEAIEMMTAGQSRGESGWSSSHPAAHRTNASPSSWLASSATRCDRVRWATTTGRRWNPTSATSYRRSNPHVGPEPERQPDSPSSSRGRSPR
jgi:pimeloyl-ACP methyl ester carboxylesterase